MLTGYVQDNTALDIKVSNNVQEDDKKRKEKDPRYHNEVRGGRHFPLNFLGGRPLVLPLVNGVPLRPGQANAPGPDAQARLANPPRPEVHIEQEDGGRQPQRLGHFRAVQRAQQQIAKQLDNRKRDLLARLADQAPFARPAMPQGRQPADYNGAIPHYDLAPVPAVHQNKMNARAQLGRSQHHHRPNANNNNEGPRTAQQPQGNGREQAQARLPVFADAQQGFRRYNEMAQRLFGNDYGVAAAADGRPPNHVSLRRDVNPNNANVRQNRAARQEGPHDAFLLGGIDPDIFNLLNDPPPFAPKPEFPVMHDFLNPPPVNPVAGVDQLQRGCHAVLRNPEQPELRPGRHFGSINPARRQVAPQVSPGPAPQNERA